MSMGLTAAVWGGQRGAAGADALCVIMSGDTFQGILQMTRPRDPEKFQRPLSLDLLWQARTPQLTYSPHDDELTLAAAAAAHK